MTALFPFIAALLSLMIAGVAWPAADESAGLAQEGRALYRGETRLARPATLQGVPMPAGGCITCHGSRGDAQREGGVTVPAIQWHPLTQPGSGQPAYADADAVSRAIEHGVGRLGQALQPPMPRFAFSAQERRALMAYLRVLATDAEPIPGITPSRVVVASVLPLSGTQAATGERIRAALSARFDSVNAAGGIFGRSIEFRAIDAGPSVASASQAARAALQAPGEGIFAFVGSLLPEPDAALRAQLQLADVPMVATLGVARVEPTLPQLSYLLPSISTQVRHLVSELARRCGTPVGAALVLHPPGAAFVPELTASLPSAQLRGVGDNAQLESAMLSAVSLPVVALLPPETLGGVRARLASRQSPGCLGTLAVISGSQPTDDVPPLSELVALPMPPLVEERSGALGAALWSRLGDAAAQVFAETLARSGRSVDATGFARALNSLHRYQLAAGLSVTFGPHKRSGFDVAYLSRENQHATPSQ